MTPLCTLTLKFHSWWRNSSGHGDGPHIDDRVERDGSELPFIPGKTLKGLFRDAALQLAALGHQEEQKVQRAFGLHVDDIPATDRSETMLDARYLTEPGQLRFGSASLPDEWQRWARGAEDHEKSVIDALFDVRAMTAIDSAGVAKDGSLRRHEVIVPLGLNAKVWGDDSSCRDLLTDAAPLIRSIGAGRNRGFGRVEIAVGDPA